MGEQKEQREVVVYTNAGGFGIEVLVESERFWLNRQQLSKLFGRDVKTIGKHIANALKEELRGLPVVAKFATTARDGKCYQVEHYGLDVILSVGYRVKSPEGVRFRTWANGVLRTRILRTANDNRLLQELEKRFSDHEFRLADVEQAMKYVLGTLMPAIPATERIGFQP